MGVIISLVKTWRRLVDRGDLVTCHVSCFLEGPPPTKDVRKTRNVEQSQTQTAGQIISHLKEPHQSINQIMAHNLRKRIRGACRGEGQPEEETFP